MVIPRWAGALALMVPLSVLGTAYVINPNAAGRADECLGNTSPIERGMMRNRCDHALSVMACAIGMKCAAKTVQAQSGFSVNTEAAVIAHACRAPYLAVKDDDGRGCRAPE